MVAKIEPFGLPSWVSDKTIRLKMEKDEVKRKYIIFKSPQLRERRRKLNVSLNNSYKVDEAAAPQADGRPPYDR